MHNIILPKLISVYELPIIHTVAENQYIYVREFLLQIDVAVKHRK